MTLFFGGFSSIAIFELPVSDSSFSFTIVSVFGYRYCTTTVGLRKVIGKHSVGRCCLKCHVWKRVLVKVGVTGLSHYFCYYSSKSATDCDCCADEI